MDRHVTMTPRMNQILGRAFEIARAHGHTHVGTEHFLLALLHDDGGIAGSVLQKLGVADEIESTLEELLASDGYNTPADPGAKPGDTTERGTPA
jgi:ATP-dependent Clp protease ATP-binding subunit ClpA